VAGTIIGNGIFLKTTMTTQQVGSPEVVLLGWPPLDYCRWPALT
jgi:hypothetical protein